jgi:hypothetical protein
MPDKRGKTTAKDKELPDTPLHAYKEGREEDVKGDPTARDVAEAPVEERDDPGKH